MFSHMKLGTKLAGGFALLILMAVGLGGLAIFRMQAVSNDSTTLEKDAVPTVKVANEVERQSLLVMYNIRGYGMTQDEKYLKLGREHLEKVNSALKDALQLASDRKLVDLEKASTSAKEGVDAYEKLVDETARIITEDTKGLEAMTQYATAFMDSSNKFLRDQETKLTNEINSNTASAKLVERASKITMINDVIDLGNACRIANFKARALNDPTVIQKQLAAFDAIASKLSEIEAIVRTDANKQQLETIRKSGEEYKAAMIAAGETMTKLKDLGAKRQTVADQVLEQGKAQTLAGVDKTQEIAIGASKALNSANNVMKIGLVLVAIIGAVLAYSIAQGILRPVKAIVTRIKDIAQGEGDLTQRVQITTQDEIGELGTWFNTFVDKVHGIISQVAQATREVASAATEIAASSEQMSAGMREQTAQTSQVSAAIEEMSSTVVEVARKSADAASDALSAGKQATEGGVVVTRTITGMEAIADVVNESAASITELGKRGEQIGDIISVINDIADQTNLLALNAAIEAARAGEHGRGFAVVADEVRKLAERTTHATKEVAQSIQAIQHETSAAVERMSAGTTKVSEGVTLARQAGDSLESIVAGAQGVAGMIQGIAAASEQQSAAAEQIARSIESISAVSRESSTGAAQAASAASQLSARSEQLQELVGRFKV